MSNEIKIKKDDFNVIRKDFIEQSGLSEASFAREASFAYQAYLENERVAQCTKNSLIKCVMNVAQTGLTLNPVKKYASIVPRLNSKKKQMEAILEPQYQGLIKLLNDAGMENIEARVVYENDIFDFDLSSEEKVKKHVPYYLNKAAESGDFLAVYSIATVNGVRHVEVMPAEQVYEIREKSESYKAFVAKKISTCIWVEFPEEMYRKTVIKRHYKYLPKSDFNDNISNAIHLDNQVNGFRAEISASYESFVEGRILTSAFDDDYKQELINQLTECQFIDEAQIILREVDENQQPTLDSEIDRKMLEEDNREQGTLFEKQ